MAKNTVPQAGKGTPITKGKLKANKKPMQPAKQAVPGNMKGNPKPGTVGNSAKNRGMY